jgi:Holliday junction resolvasome RuvABC endonuclease subunit
MIRILGVDPGVRGGLAVVEISDGAAPELVDAIDIPTVGVGAKERVDSIALRTWLATHQPQHALIERAQAMPEQWASSGFKYDRAAGAIEAGIALCEVPLTLIEPSQWNSTGSTAATRSSAGAAAFPDRKWAVCAVERSWPGNIDRTVWIEPWP